MDIKHIIQSNIYYNKIITILSTIIKIFKFTFITSMPYYLRKFITDPVYKI